MKNLLSIVLLLFSSYSFSETVTLHMLNGTYSTGVSKSKSVAIILHGTRGHQNLEIVASLRDSLLENGIDSLTINLSYGIKNRVNDFLTCDMEHKHRLEDSLKEIELWYDYLENIGYQKIHLIGHSRGSLDILNFYELLSDEKNANIGNIFLLAPISVIWKDIKKKYKNKFGIVMDMLISQPNYKLKIDFLGCENAVVHSKSFLSYYRYGSSDISNNALKYFLLKNTGRVYVVTASEDDIARGTHEMVNSISKKKNNIELHMIDGADHFFRDFYFEDLTEFILDKIE